MAAIFYRGAGVGTYWRKHDARTTGFVAHSPGGSRGLPSLIGHIKDGTTTSPFISLTRSYSVAWSYATAAGRGIPDSNNKACVYEIVIEDPAPPGLVVLDPIREILDSNPNPLAQMTYAHDGFQDFLLGVISPRTMKQNLLKPILHPPPGGATSRSANLSRELEAIVRALRDAEFLAVGVVPQACVTNRWDIP